MMRGNLTDRPPCWARVPIVVEVAAETGGGLLLTDPVVVLFFTLFFAPFLGPFCLLGLAGFVVRPDILPLFLLFDGSLAATSVSPTSSSEVCVTCDRTLEASATCDKEHMSAALNASVNLI
jgi:hypothetical protein